jgi:hypothetical protein
MSNEGIVKVLNDIDNLSEEKLNDVCKVFLSDFKEANLAARGWLPVVSAYAVSKAMLNAYSRLPAKRHPLLVVCCVTPGLRAHRHELRHGAGARGAGRVRPESRLRRLGPQLRALQCVRVLIIQYTKLMRPTSELRAGWNVCELCFPLESLIA